jgi:biotin carboxylase
MATIVIVGNRDAALRAALQLEHRVILVSDRKVPKRRLASLLAVIDADFSTANALGFAKDCIAQMRLVDPNLPEQVEAVIGVTERTVLPAAWLRSHLALAGNSAESAYLCRNKLAMKRRLQMHGIECVDFLAVTGRTTAAGLIRHLGLPLVLKPVDSSGSRGAIVAREQREVEAALQPGMLAESFAHGIEMSVESFVQDGEVLFTNLTEYLVPLWSNVLPAKVTSNMRRDLVELNRKVIQALGIKRGMTHMEVFLTATAPLFSEIAVRPPGGYLMDLLGHAYGIETWPAFIRVELGHSVNFPKQPKQCAGVVLLHPGQGRVKRVKGLNQINQLPGVIEAECRVSPGESLDRRQGSGESAAHIIATGKTRTEVLQALRLARKALVVELEPSNGR